MVEIVAIRRNAEREESIEDQSMDDLIADAHERRISFDTVRSIETGFRGSGIYTERVEDDIEVRAHFAELIPDDAAILFINLFSASVPDDFLGTLMVSYTSELELV